MEDSLKKAIRMMADGDKEGFNKVYAATYNHVWFRANKIMGNEEDAKDLFQTVYLEASRGIGKLEDEEKLFGWLDGITYNQGMKMYRKNKDVLLKEESEGIFDTLETVDISAMPEPSLMEKENGNILGGLIDKLSPVLKSTLIAYHFDNFSVAEIAEMFECPEGTVKSRLNYARQNRKKMILEKEEKEGIRLHALTLPAIWYAIWRLSKETTLTAKAAENMYGQICMEAGIGAMTLQTSEAFAEAGAGVSRVMPAWSEALAGASTGSATAGGGSVTAGTGSVTVGTGSVTVGTGSVTAGGGSAAAGAAAAGGGVATKTIAGIMAAVVIAGAAGGAVIVPKLTGNDREAVVEGPSEDMAEDAVTLEEEAFAEGEEAEENLEELAFADVEAGSVDEERYVEDAAYRMAVNDARFYPLREALVNAVKDFEGVSSYDGSYAVANKSIEHKNVSNFASWRHEILRKPTDYTLTIADVGLRYIYADVNGDGKDEFVLDEWWEKEPVEYGTDFIPQTGVVDVYEYKDGETASLVDSLGWSRFLYLLKEGYIQRLDFEIGEYSENYIHRMSAEGAATEPEIVYHARTDYMNNATTVTVNELGIPDDESFNAWVDERRGKSDGDGTIRFTGSYPFEIPVAENGAAWVEIASALGGVNEEAAAGTSTGSVTAGSGSATAEDAEWKDAFTAELKRLNDANPKDNSSSEWHYNGRVLYYLYDIDKDGVPEMIVQRGTFEAAARGEVYAYRNGTVSLVADDFLLSNAQVYSCPGENGILSCMWRMDHGEIRQYTLNNEKLTWTEVLSENINSLNGEEYTDPAALFRGAEPLTAYDLEDESGVNAYKGDAD